MPLLNTLTTQPLVAVALHKLRDTQTNCIRLRRVSDNVEQDFGFASDGTLDWSAINTFKGASTVRVVRWYNQVSGSSIHIEQVTTSLQPILDTTAKEIKFTVSEANVLYSTSTVPMAGSDKVSFFANARNHNPTNGNQALFSFTGSGGYLTARWAGGIYNSSYEWIFWDRDPSGNIGDRFAYFGDSAAAAQKFRCLTWIVDRAQIHANSYLVYKNLEAETGTNAAATTAGNTTGAIANDHYVRLGVDYGITGYNADASFRSFILYGTNLAAPAFTSGTANDALKTQLELTTPAAYFDANDITGYTDGQTFSSYTDLKSAVTYTPANVLYDEDSDAAKNILFNGTNSNLLSASTVDLSHTQKITVLQAVRKTSTATSMLMEHSATIDSNSGFMYFTDGASLYATHGNGAGTTAQKAISFSASTKHLIFTQHDRSLTTNEIVSIRLNKADATVNSHTNNNVPGNFDNKTLYVGSRGNTIYFAPINVYSFAIFDHLLDTPARDYFEYKFYSQMMNVVPLSVTSITRPTTSINVGSTFSPTAVHSGGTGSISYVWKIKPVGGSYTTITEATTVNPTIPSSYLTAGAKVLRVEVTRGIEMQSVEANLFVGEITGTSPTGTLTTDYDTNVPTPTWIIDSGSGSINSSTGVFTRPGTGSGTTVIRATGSDTEQYATRSISWYEGLVISSVTHPTTSINLGSNATPTVNTTGGAGTKSYVWKVDGTPVSGTNVASPTIPSASLPAGLRTISVEVTDDTGMVSGSVDVFVGEISGASSTELATENYTTNVPSPIWSIVSGAGSIDSS